MNQVVVKIKSNDGGKTKIMNENTKDLWDCVNDIIQSPNYGLTDAIKLALRINPRPFYGAFGNEEAVKANVRIIAEDYEKYVDDIGVSFKLEPSKLLKGLFFQIPECKGEMDSLYLVIVYQGTYSGYYVCEYMDGKMYALRKNDEKIITCFNNAPSVDDVWSAINAQYEPCENKNIFVSCIYSSQQKVKQYLNFDYGNTEFVEHWFGSECMRTKLDYEGHNYWILYAPEKNDFLVMGDKEGKPGHLQESDISVIPSVIDFGIHNIDDIKKQPAEPVLK